MIQRWLSALLCIFFGTILLAESGIRQHVILISLDGFRWDYSERGITPALGMMQREGVAALSLEPAWPTKTFPNHITIVTGMYPENHGILLNEFINPYKGERYRIGDSSAVRDPRWYQGEMIWEAAERQGVRTASYFWPGSELFPAHRRPSIVMPYDHDRPYEERVDGVLAWLALPEAERPRFMTLYFHETDTQGHIYGAESPEIDAAIKQVDGLLSRLFSGIEELQMWDRVNVIVVSDHGMTEVSLDRMTNIEAMLNEFTLEIVGSGPYMLIWPEEDQIAAVYEQLRRDQKHFATYLREEVPRRFHFSKHPFIAPIVLIPDMGWTLVDNGLEEWIRGRPGRGNHGYDNRHLDMHGIFHAIGPAFRKGHRRGTVRNIDIYPLICKILGIAGRTNIDGRLEHIGDVLRTE